MTMTTHSDSCAPAGAEAISIYEAIGGRSALAAAVDDFYGRLVADPVLGPFFRGGVGARHRAGPAPTGRSTRRCCSNRPAKPCMNVTMAVVW